jgi:hypothetical protein
LDFIRWTAPAEQTAIAGKSVVRKCCDRNEVYSQNLICIENNRGASTQFFDDLQFAKSDELFFRFGLPICSDPFLYRRQTIDFVLNSNGSLEINSGSNLVSIENYCMEDIVYKDSVGLPVTSNLAIFCSDQKMELSKKEEVAPAEKPTISETESEMVTRNESSIKVNMPKCCPSGSVMDERDNSCQPLRLEDESSDADSIISRALNSHIQKNYNISSTLMANTSISCPFIKNIPLQPMYHSFGKLLFESVGEENNSLSLLTHFYFENYWDLKVKHRPFCLDLALLRNEREVFYQPKAFYCTSKSHRVSIHYPILLLISAAGLLATFIIYFIVPASGNITFHLLFHIIFIKHQ